MDPNSNAIVAITTKTTAMETKARPGSTKYKNAGATLQSAVNPAIHGFRRPLWSAMAPSNGPTSATASPAPPIA